MAVEAGPISYTAMPLLSSAETKSHSAASGQRGRHLVPHVARVVQVVGVGEHLLHEGGELSGGLLGEGGREAGDILRRRSPREHGEALPSGGAGQVVGELIHELMPLTAEVLGVVGGGSAVSEGLHGGAP